MRDSLLVRAFSCALFATVVAVASAACGTSTDGDGADGGTPGADGGVNVVAPGTKCQKDDQCGTGRCVTGGCVPGAACKDDSTCNGEHCVMGGCVPASATDGSKDGDETDTDCGGSVAPRCAVGKGCVAGGDCVTKICTAGVCVAPSSTDGQQNGDETDVDCGGKTAPKCATGKMCLAGADCASAVCGKNGTCSAPTSTDGVKNGTETDIDCGGGAPTNAPACATGKACVVVSDCVWDHCDGAKCGGHVMGTKDGDETDVDCGGKMSPACDWAKACLADGDCTSNACDLTKHCAVGPSCKTAVHGGNTCGLAEYDAGGNYLGTDETCCKSLPVGGYTDPNHAGKTVYLDKYEITAGRMRAFINYVSAQNGGVPNVQGYMAAHRPPATAWNPNWENILPQANYGSDASYTIKYPTPANNLEYPGEDLYLANHPTQNTWWIGDVNGAFGVSAPPAPNGNIGMTAVPFTVDTGVFYAFGTPSFFPEYYANANWPPPTEGPTYAEYHSQNCSNQNGSYGLSTYWFDANTISTYGGGVGKFFSQDQLDEKTLNCTPNALLAAFCAWDGGQIPTAEVMDFVTGNTVSPVYDGGYPNGKYAPGQSQCGPGGNSLITYSDGAASVCYTYYFPYDDGKEQYDGTSRIAPPGRVPADVITQTAGAEPWMDMIGNMQEAVLKKGETDRFDYRGYGTEYGSIIHHKNQQSTPRFKSGAFGARCMRFK